VDYKKLAEKFGGTAEETQLQETPSVDYTSLAEQFGGVAEEMQPPAQPPAQPVATGKPASVIPQLPVTPTKSTVPKDEGFFGRNYRYAKDNLISGFENLRASSKGTSFAVARGYIQSFERKYGGPGVPLAPPDVKKEYEKYKAEARQYAQDIAGFQKEAQERQLASPPRPETARLKAAMGDDLTFMESAKEAGAALFSNPVGVIADLGAESLPNMAYMVSTSLLVRLGLKSPTAAAVGGGTSSAVSQFGNEYVDRLQKGESHDEAWKNAAIRSGVIGTFDAVSLKTAGSAAGKIVEALKTGKPASVAAKEFIKETGKQAGLGGAGEAAGSLAIGEIPNPAAVIAEMAGETVTGPFEAISTYQRVKGVEKLSKEDQAIADLDKLAADEEAEEARRAAIEEVEEATSGLIGEEDLFAEEAAAAIPPQETIPTTTAAAIPPQETIPATPEELKKIDKDLRKKLGRAPIFEETEAVLNDFEQEKTRRLRAESGGRGPTVPVLSGEEAVSGVTGAPERVEPTKLGRAVEPTDVSGARKEPTLGAVKPEDLELDAATAIETTAKAKEPTLGAVKPEDQINTAKKMMADLAKQPLNVENVAGQEIVGDVKKYKGFKIYKVKEGYSTHWRAQSPENQALNKIGKGDSYHESLELAKDAVGDNLNDKFDAETFARRLLPKLTEGKATPTAPEPTRVRTVEDLSPEDKAAFDSETAEIRASMKEATNAAKERGLPFTNAAAPFVDQLRALDQSYGIGEPISEKRTAAQLAAELGGTADEDSGFRPAKDEENIVETPGTDPVGFARVQAIDSFDRRNSSDYSSPEEAIDFGLDNLNDTLTEYGVTDPYIREQAVEAYKNEIASLKEKAAAGVRPATDEDISMYNVDATPQMTEAEISQGVTDVREEQIAEYARLRAKKGRLVQKVIGGSNTIDTQRELTNLDNVTKALKEAIDVEYTPSTSPARFLSRALDAFDKGDISAEVLATIQNVYNKTPFILNGLRLSIKTPKDDTREIGNFNPLERIVTLWNGTRGVENPSTVLHELMHSLEQMMTKGAKEAIINAWYKAFQKGIKKYKDPKSQEFFHKVLDFLDKPNNESLDVAIKALPSYDFYQYINPSEFWAVNAEKLFAAKLGSGWERFKSAVRKLFEALKDTFGFDNNYAVHKTFDSLIKGKAPRGGSDITNYLLSGKKVNFLSNVENLDTELEQKVIELSLKVGDIHPTMVSAIANNDLNGALLIASQKLSGFSAELAKKLLDLKLPTNISFNNGRDLVRHSIDNMSAPQQQRLFRYVEMHYPQVYDKYFKNYDRSESLETVAEGLIELQKPNYKLGPVITEFGTVSGAYKEHIKGLTSPGAYYPRYDEIVLNTNTLSGKSYRVFLHEVVHAATEYALNTYGTDPQNLTPGQRESVKELTRMYNYALKEIGSAPYGMTNIYEFISEVFTNKKFQELLKGIKYKSDKPTFLSKLIKAIFKAVGFDNLASNAMVEATNIFSAVRSQTTIDRGPRFAKSGPKTPRIRGPISQTWRTAESQVTSLIQVFNDGLKGRRSWDEVLKIIGPSMWNGTTGPFRRSVLGFLNLRQIDDLTKTKFPQISGAIRTIEKMIAYRGNIMQEAETIVKEWTKAQAKKPNQSRLMGRLMIETTLRGIDPDRPGTKAINAALVQAWNQLDPEFKQIYRQVRDFYARSVTNMVRDTKLKVSKNSSLTLSEKKVLIKEINSKFGPDKLVQPYFPLRRFGKFFYQVGKGDFKEFYTLNSEKDREVAMRVRENDLSKGNAQQQALVKTIKKRNGLSELISKNLSTTQVFKEVDDLINNITATTVDDAKAELKDSFNQLMYILLPQQSMRKMFINRKGIQGASSDMLRVFATSAVHSAYQQSRFKFSDEFLNNLKNAYSYVNEFSNKDMAAVYGDYIREIEKRIPYILSNEDTSLGAVVAGKASETTFFFMLSAPFSAMLNVIGVAQITMPYIGGRYGYAKTNALMLKNMSLYFATMPRRSLLPLVKGQFMDVSFPSIFEGATLSPLLNRAARRFIEDQTVNISMTNDLMDMGARPSSLYTGRYDMVKKILSGLFHQSERLGREVSLITTFELAYDVLSKSPKKDLRGVIERDAQGKPVMYTPDEAYEAAILEAKDIVSVSLGDFTRQMKPRYFVSPLMSVITKFKQYAVLATYAVVRNFYFLVAAPFRKAEIEEFRQQMIADKISPKIIEQRLSEAEAQRKELYREGRRRLAGILAVTYILGGNEASPFYSIGIGPLVKMLANEDDDEFFDWENWLKNYMEEEVGGAAGDFFAEMGMNPETADEAGRFVGGSLQRGLVSELTGGNLSSRVSLDVKNMWYREGRYSQELRESVTQNIIANSGPVVGLGFNWLDSYDLFQKGQYQRAFEKAAPGLISKPVTAERIADEGAKTASGVKLADNFSAWELAMLSIGLQPTRLAQAQQSLIESKQRAEKIKDRRKTLLNRLWMERDSFEGTTETMENITKFNLKYPLQRIEPIDIQNSFKRRSENQAQADLIGGKFEKDQLLDALQMLRYGRE
jgi:hypothetical protein